MSYKAKTIPAMPAGMESDETSDDDQAFFETDMNGKMNDENGISFHFNEDLKRFGRNSKSDKGDINGAGDNFGQLHTRDDDLEGIFENGVPVDETLKLDDDNFPSLQTKAPNVQDTKNPVNGQKSWASVVTNFGPPVGSKRQRLDDSEGEDEVMNHSESATKAKNYSRVLSSFRFKNEPLSGHDDELEKILTTADLAHLIPLFKDGGIALNEFLIMTDLDFEQLGVESVGERKRLQNLLCDIHSKPWSERSLINPSSNFSSIEAVKMISNIHGHLVCMESTLVYLCRVIDHKQLAPVDAQNFKKLLRELDHTILAVPTFEKGLRKVRLDLQKMGNPGDIEVGNTSKFGVTGMKKFYKRILAMNSFKKVALCTGPPIAFYVIYRKFMKG